jgi:cyclic dehypoxanthinyl futalosine synthase
MNPSTEPAGQTPSSLTEPPATGRLRRPDLRDLYFDAPIHELGRRALAATNRLHPEDYRTYVVDRNINYANWCTAKCIFCNFKADPPDMPSGRGGLPRGYTLTYRQIGEKIEELIAIGGTQLLMQGGLVPAEGEVGLPFDWYLDLMRFIKKNYPQIHIHAFSPPEIFAFGQVFGMAVPDVLARLREAGLESVPGGGAEILSDRVRAKIGIGKTDTAQWLEVMRQCHILGMKTSCTMMFGHIETLDERFEHLELLRDLQDESLARNNGGGFSAYICWPFQPAGTPLGRMKQLPLDTPEPTSHPIPDAQSSTRNPQSPIRNPRSPIPNAQSAIPNPQSPIRNPQSAIGNRPINDGHHLLLADAHEYLTTLALARLYLDNIPNIQSSWVTMGPKIGQLALFFGANDMGSVMMEENVVSAAGTTFRLNEPEIRRLITDAGWKPQKRDYYYRPID